MGATSSTGNYPPIVTRIGDNSSAGVGSGTSASSSLLLPHSTAYFSSIGNGGSGGSSSAVGLVLGGPHSREQRRKRVTGFATLKRKFIRRRRSSKAYDHARILRDFVSDWTPLELAALCEEYEALAALKDLSV